MKQGLFQVLFPFFLVIIPSLSQISFGTLGRGLNSGYLQNGGLVYPNTDGSGPQASSLAAAIYGVAVPPGFNQFSASENFFGENRGDLFSDSFGSGISDEIKPSDLLLGTGIHTGGNGGGQRGSYSTYISDFSVFGDFGHHANNDQKPSSSSLVEIDPIAARFGVVIPNVDQVPFDPSLSGSTESFVSGSTSTGAGDGRKDLFNVSPVETSIKFDLPTQTSLSDAVQFSTQFSTNINNLSVAFASQHGLPRTDESFSVETASNSHSSSDTGKNQVDMITTAFKFSDDQIIKTEEIKRNFEHATAAHIASGKYTASLSSTELDTIKNLEKGTENVQTTVANKEKNDQSKTKIHPKQKEASRTSNEFIVSQIKSTSPYVYRGSQRGQQQAQQSERDIIITEAPENIPEFQYLKAHENDEESYTIPPKEPVAQYHSSYGFLTSPGYRTYHN